MTEKQGHPTVFISSTVADLKDYRHAAKEAAIRTGFYPVMQEYFTAEGARRPLDECLHKVEQCDVLVVLIAHRYGWIPDDQSPSEQKSITWLECQHAHSMGKEVLAFIVDPKHDWQEKLKEKYRIQQAFDSNELTESLQNEVKNAIANLEKFKQWINDNFVRDTFTTPENLEKLVLQSLNNWRSRKSLSPPPESVQTDPVYYLQLLHRDCAYIRIRGLQVGTSKAHNFGIEELYIPLTTSHSFDPKSNVKDKQRMQERPARVELHQVLQQQRITIIGDPGAGKTTFLRRISFLLCQSLLRKEPDVAQKRLGLKKPYFPVFIRLSELVEHIHCCVDQNKQNRPTTETDPTWLAHFLTEKSTSMNWGLSQKFFLDKFSSGDAILLLDGLDEAPDRRSREKISELVTHAIRAYQKCRFVVTSRPRAYSGKVVLDDFSEATIEPLEEPAMETFLHHWSQALFREHEDAVLADTHYQELAYALHSRPDIKKLARNPVMLTALAVVHWNERRLPEQRADLYESIITWLLRSREQRPDRLKADQCRLLLQRLALAMQTHPDGRKVQLGRRQAAVAIQAGFPEKSDEECIRAAERFLEEEEVDSGIVVARGTDITFWHLTFQEYLTAKALGGKVESEQQSLLTDPNILHSAEWRETLLLFAGVLYKQGLDKINGFFSAILDMVTERKPALADEARCVGLLGAMLHDLSPFDYVLADSRYRDMLDRVMGIFDKEKACNLSVQDRSEAADALGQAGDPRLNEAQWIPIPGGSFLMGAQKKDSSKNNYDENAYPDESPVHEITLSPFEIRRYPVTVQEYKRFVDDGGYSSEKFWADGGYKKFDAPDDWQRQQEFPNRPVVGVSWYEAAAYCRWAGVQLPTEAQWERVARGPGKDYRKFPWGNQPLNDTICNSNRCGLKHPSPVGVFPEDCTEEGVMDMGGNVGEWCRDWKDVKYEQTSQFYERSLNSKDPVNDEHGNWGKIGDLNWRVVRGGSWGYDDEDDFRCSVRDDVHPVIRVDYVGFRVVRSPQFYKGNPVI